MDEPEIHSYHLALRKWDTQHLGMKKRPCITFYFPICALFIFTHLNINLQKSFPTAKRSKEQFSWEAHLSTHSIHSWARPRKRSSLVLHNCNDGEMTSLSVCNCAAIDCKISNYISLTENNETFKKMQKYYQDLPLRIRTTKSAKMTAR